MEPRKSIRNVHNSSERQKINTLESVDRIGTLPDTILGAILSLLPTKNAVATSALSKRWEFVWRTVHNLDFCHEVQGRRTVEQVEDENEKFVGFVNHVLAHHDAGVLNKFRLVWTPDCIESHATSWIKTAITRNVHVLSLTLDYCNDQFYDMPISVFSCDSLQSLHLNGMICLSAATVLCLPRLEILYLNRVTFQSNEDFEKIIRGCPVLNYLHVDIDEDITEVRFIISSTSLRRLELHSQCLECCYKNLELEASSLEHLTIYGYKSVKFVQKKLCSLVEANLRIYFDYDDFSPAGICDSVVDAVSALDCAKILTLSQEVMQALSYGTTSLSTNFTPVEVPRCLSTSLKKIVLDGYCGFEDEREMIRYMLKHGSVLEDVQISCHIGKNRKKFELVQEICDFPRKSTACKVKFLGWT